MNTPHTLVPFTRRRAAAALFALLSGSAFATDGTETAIRLGMSAPLSGGAAIYGRQLRQGIEACFARINAAGGVLGRRLVLVTLDDGQESAAAAANARRLIDHEKVLALIGFYGTSPTEAVLPILESAGVPLIGTVSGADALRGPDNHRLFHLRASYGDETAAIMRNLATVGLTRVAVFFQDDALGHSGLAGVRHALAMRSLEPVAIGKVPQGSVDVAAAADAIAKSNAQAVVMVSLARPAAAFVREMRKAGASPYFVALSPVGTDQLLAELGAAHTRGIQVAQVIPNPWLDKLAVVREYKDALAALDPNAVVSYHGLEGYLEARLAAAAMERAGPNPTRETVTAALRTGSFDLGGYRVRFARAGNAGSNYVEISVVGVGGRILN